MTLAEIQAATIEYARLAAEQAQAEADAATQRALGARRKHEALIAQRDQYNARRAEKL
jgi:hypothetical protein